MEQKDREEMINNVTEHLKSLMTKDKERFIEHLVDDIKDTLTEKNRRYGNSVGEPLNIFSGLNSIEGINQRIDDKLKRVKTNREKGKDHRKNDIFDLIGYLVLLCVQSNWDDFSDLLD